MTSSKRQRELARRRAERQAVRRVEAARRQRRRSIVSWSVGLAVLALVVAVPVYRAVTKDDGEPAAQPSASATPTPTGTPAPLTIACDAKEPTAAKEQTFEKAPAMTIDAKKTYVATITTSCGEVVVEMLADKAPTIVNSFAFLAGKKYFDGTQCHRLLATGDFVVQCGDPTATGSGSPGYKLKDENLPSPGKDFTYPRGTLAMANSGKDTNGSQFFFVVKPSPFKGDYAVIGKVTKGLEVLDKLLAVGVSPGTDQPAQRIFIESFTVKAT